VSCRSARPRLRACSTSKHICSTTTLSCPGKNVIFLFSTDVGMCTYTCTCTCATVSILTRGAEPTCRRRTLRTGRTVTFASATIPHYLYATPAVLLSDSNSHAHTSTHPTSIYNLLSTATRR
jgi:hypothetical protein